MLGSVAVIDACALYAAPVRDALLSLADEGLYRPIWTLEIHQEWKRNLATNRPDIPAGGIESLCNIMLEAFPDALASIEGFDLNQIILPDADDRHVVAAAIRSDASLILTQNLKDFPSKVLQAHGVEAFHPDTFIRNLCDQDLAACLRAIKKQRARLKRHPKSPLELLDSFDKSGLKQTATLLRNHLSEI